MKRELDETARRAIFKASPLLMGFLSVALQDAQFSENDSAWEESREARDTGTIFDCPDDTLWHARTICDAFYGGRGGELAAESACDYEQIGSDLYLESAGHGAGFQDRTHADDREESERIGAGLSAAVDCKYLESYLGDDGAMYFVGGETAFAKARSFALQMYPGSELVGTHKANP